MTQSALSKREWATGSEDGRRVNLPGGLFGLNPLCRTRSISYA
jgi:hypothetical protein